MFYKPSAELNEHPGYANVLEGDEHLGRLLCKIEQSPIWSKSIVIVTFDENGGYWDHVPPPDDRSLGPRHARSHGDHLALRQEGLCRPHDLRFDRDPEAYRDCASGFEYLGDRDKKSKDLTNAFDFDGPPPEPVCKTLESGGVRN